MLMIIRERLYFIQISVRKYSIGLSTTSLSATIYWFCSNYFPWRFNGYSVEVAGITISSEIASYINFNIAYIFLIVK